MTTADPTAADADSMTRAHRAELPLSAEVAQALAEQHGVCIRPLAMRRIDTTTGRIDIVPVPCGSTREDHRVRTRPGGCGWSSVARAGIWTPNRSPSGPPPARNTRS
jgi:hypothetical protein